MAVLIRNMAVLLVAIPAMFLAVPAWSGGDNYDATAATAEDAGPSYFGFVKDARGTPVPDAKVTLRPKSGKVVEVKTNKLGLYRSHVRKDVNPRDVEISCQKDGYKQTRVFLRTDLRKAAIVIETDCTLQRA